MGDRRQCRNHERKKDSRERFHRPGTIAQICHGIKPFGTLDRSSFAWCRCAFSLAKGAAAIMVRAWASDLFTFAPVERDSLTVKSYLTGAQIGIRYGCLPSSTSSLTNLFRSMKISPCLGILILTVSLATARGDDGNSTSASSTAPSQALVDKLVQTIPGQLVDPLPGQLVPPLPGQLVPLLPGQLVPPLTGQIVRGQTTESLPGQLMRSLPGQLVRSLPGRVGPQTRRQAAALAKAGS